MSEFKTIRELREAQLPRATIDDIGKLSATNDTDEAAKIVAEATEEINRYLASFTPGPCPGCGAELGGIFGSFQWGICTGEGACARCEYPARGQHASKYLTGSFVLPYHPDLLAAYSGSPDFEESRQLERRISSE